MNKSRRAARLLVAALLVIALAPAGLRPSTAHAAACSAWMDPSKTPEQRATALLAAMTIDQKVALTQNQAFQSHGGTAGYIAGVPALCLPDLVLNDAGQGVGDTDNGPSGAEVTAFPAPIAQSSSWDPAVQRQFGAELGSQAWQRGVNVQLAPGIEVDRVYTNGRNWEYMSEDPYLAGQTAAAVVAGLQSSHVVATAKHYMANSQEFDRMSDSSDVDQRTLHEIYMLPYEAAIKQSHLGSVMCSYNRIDSIYACENGTVLNRDLKGDLGFDGWVMSDWGATHSTVASANGGLDQEMNVANWMYFGPTLKTAVQNGQVPMSRVNDMVFRILRVMFQVGLFDHVAPPTPALPSGPGTNVDSAAADTLARQIAESGAVLLKNTQSILPLPLGVGKRIAVIGESAAPVGAELVYNGGGSGHIPEFGYRPVTNPLQSMTTLATPSGDVITYNDGTNATLAAATASAADVAVVFAYDSESEGTDRPNLSLPVTPQQCTLFGCVKGSVDQDALISAVAAANPNTVVVLETGGPVLMPWLSQVKGVMEAWYPGEMGGDAIANVLFGQVSPSGKLPETFPKKENETPVNTPEQYPGTNADSIGPHSRYTEGINVGYRWYDSNNIAPLFPFGHGLSYTTFRYSNLVVAPAASPSGTATASFDVTNTGSRDGAEVAQVYVGAPANNYAFEPPQQLRGYQRLNLKKGQTAHVSLPINSRAVSYWSGGANAWVPETGCHPVTVGSSSRDIRLQGQGLDGNLALCTLGVATTSVSTPNTSSGRPVPTWLLLGLGFIAGTAVLAWRRRLAG